MGIRWGDIQLMVDMLHLTPTIICGESTKLRMFEEVTMPKKMRGWKAGLGRVWSFVKTRSSDGECYSWPNLPSASCSSPVYAVSYSLFYAPPWKPNDAEHVRDQENGEERRPDVGFRQPQSLRIWVLAYLRYVMAGHMCDGQANFGGFSAQLDFLSIARHPSVVGNPGIVNWRPPISRSRREDRPRP